MRKPQRRLSSGRARITSGHAKSNAYAIAAAVESTGIRRSARVARALQALQPRRTSGHQKFSDCGVHDKRAGM
jgi:hypothetical protein